MQQTLNIGCQRSIFQIEQLNRIQNSLFHNKQNLRINNLRTMDQYLIQEYASSESASNQHAQITLKQIASATHQQILQIIHQKDVAIQNFSQQITRLKAEDIKSKKLISSLQQKIQKHLASGTNTSSTFMIASQFKSLLTTFMTNTIPGVFYDFVDHPIIYAKLVKKIMLQVYSKIQQTLEGKLRQIANLLTDSQRNIQQLRLCLLNYFQNNFKEIFMCKLDESNTSLISIKTNDDEINDKVETLNSQQVQSSEEMNQFCQQLYRICVYMILQESKWEFVFDDEKDEAEGKEKPIYSKKDFTCIDGFTKEGNQVCYVLKALRKKNNSDKEYHYHPNIKNFVLPVNDNELSKGSFDLEVRINFLESTESNQVIKQKITKLFQNQSIQTNENILTDRMMQVSRNILKTHEGLKIQGLSDTQNSQIMEIYNGKIESKAKQVLQQNCIVNPTYHDKAIKNQADKQNINSNCENHNYKSKAHNVESLTKKQKNSKKSKKQKNSSTIDLTNQKRKLSQKQPNFQREAFDDLTNNLNSAKYYQLPLGNSTHAKGSQKKKGVSSNKAGRKCSVGKIISQSIHMNGSCRPANREKIALSQHSTMLVKQQQPCATFKPTIIKDNNYFNTNDLHSNLNHQNSKQPSSHHLYQKHLVRPKKSVKLPTKSIQQRLFSFNSNIHEERPLMMMVKQHVKASSNNNNGVNIARLREKYLAD